VRNRYASRRAETAVIHGDGTRHCAWCGDHIDRDEMRAWYTAWFDTWQAWLGRVRATIDADPHAALKRYADFSIRCCQCGRALTDDTSKVLGIGPECRRGIDPALLAAITTPQVAAAHAAASA
jgi:hypothetical protein